MELMHFGFRRVVAGPDRELEKRGLGRVHHRILYVVARNPGLSVGALISLLGVTKQALSAPLRRLTELGFLKAESAESNRRLKAVALTTAGLRFEKKISDLQRARFDKAFRRVGKHAVAGWRAVMDDLAEGSRLRV